MLTRRDLELSDERLQALLRERTSGAIERKGAPAPVKDAAVLFQLDDEVRNGGFAQYFFNASCQNAFDAWFATGAVDAVANELLSLALVRLGQEFGVDLDLDGLVEKGGGEALGPAFGALLDVWKRAHTTPGEVRVQFMAFRDRLAGVSGALAGFDALNRRFFDETRLSASVVSWVRAEPEPFLG